MQVWVYGNIDDTYDSLPVKLIPDLEKRFPQFLFTHKDPLDEGEFPDPLIIIDSVKQIPAVSVFDTLDAFIESPRTTVHDFDVYTALKLAEKIGKLPTLHIIGVPLGYDEKKAFSEVAAILSEY